MATKYDITVQPPKALTFDVFGTVVDWRSTIVHKLISEAASKKSVKDLSADLHQHLSGLTNEDWAKFAQEWRDAYKAFTKSYNPNEDPWRDIDTHHLISLKDLLKKWKLEGLYTDKEVKELSLIWHFLTPWQDTSKGMHLLNQKFITSSLSNGNQSLLKDLNTHGNIGFQHLISGEDFKTYKPHPSTYLGAAEKLGVKPEETAMVATHLNDLKAARSQGFRTIYVEREQEEDWDPAQEEYREAREWVDMWVPLDQEGFVEVAHRFGIDQ